MLGLLRNRIASCRARAAVLGFLAWTVTGVAFAGDAPAPASIAECKNTLGKDAVCRCQIELLHPTQISVGMIQVTKKAAKLAKKSDKKLEAYLEREENRVPVVMGPDWVIEAKGQTSVTKGFLYMVDHHHLSRALIDIGKTEAYCQIKEITRRGQSVDAFWTGMIASKQAWPRDENGVERPPQAIPSSVDGLKDDPYRSLGGAVVKACGFKDRDREPEYFLEFKWANYLRTTGITLVPDGSNFPSALDKAKELAKSADTAELRGNVQCEDKSKANAEENDGDD
ncbi:MAG: hypothetical protein JOY64_21350 [Alphaproteobacteria bacterium]|nr:hypothetical protein [Alphaproteobacteria bacterium]